MTTPSRRRTRARRPAWKILLQLLLAAALLAVVFIKVDFREFGRAFAAIGVWYVVAACLLRVAVVGIKSVRLQRLGSAHVRTTVFEWVSANANGFLIGIAVPGLCDFTRAYVLKRRARVPFGAAFSLLVVERVLDIVLLLAVFAVMLLVLPYAKGFAVFAIIVGVLVAIGLAALVVLVVVQQRSGARIERWLARLSPRLAGRISAFLASFAGGLRSLVKLPPLDIAGIVGLSLLQWVLRALSVFLVCRSLGLDVGLEASLFVAAVEFLGMIVRLTPAGVGQYQVVIIAALAVFGVDKTLAAGVSIALHAVRFLVTVLLGLPFLYAEHLGLARLAHEQEATGEQAEPTAAS